MKKITILTMFVCLLGISKSFAQEMVNISVDQGNPPFSYQNAGKAAGFYPALVESTFQSMQIPVAIEALPWKRLIDYADKGKTGIAGIYKTADRLKKYDFSNEIFQDKLVLFVLKDNGFPYNNISDLKGKKIGVIRGWSYGDEFDSSKKSEIFSVAEADSDDTNFKKLLGKRIDCVIAIKQSGQGLIAKNNLEGKIIQLPLPVAINSAYLIFSKTANQTDLLTQFNTVLKEMKADGKYEELIQNVFSKY